jgi:cell division protein FtsW (lipid II flippase)
VQGLVGPLLAVSFVLVLAVHIPHVGVSINGARRWIGPGIFQFEPSELLKLALVLYSATLLARKPRHVHDLRALARPLLWVVGAYALLFLYGLIGYAGLRAAKRARSLYSALIAVGMTSLILSQAVLNVFAVLGLAPLTGVPLPFVSYGSSSLIVMLAAMGLLLNVASGTSAHVRAVDDARARKRAGLAGERNTAQDRDRGRRESRARGAGARGG